MFLHLAIYLTRPDQSAFFEDKEVEATSMKLHSIVSVVLCFDQLARLQLKTPDWPQQTVDYPENELAQTF